MRKRKESIGKHLGKLDEASLLVMSRYPLTFLSAKIPLYRKFIDAFPRLPIPPHVIVLREICDFPQNPSRIFAGLPGGVVVRIAGDDQIVHPVPPGQVEQQAAGLARVMVPPVGLLHPVADAVSYTHLTLPTSVFV